MKAISLLILLVACASHRPDPLQEPLLALKPSVRECFLHSSQKNETTTFKLEFKINMDGSTQDHKLIEKKPALSKELEECLLKVAKGLKYGPREDMTLTVRQAFNYHP